MNDDICEWMLREVVFLFWLIYAVFFCLFQEKYARRLFWLIGTHELLYMFAPSPAVPPNWNSSLHPPVPSTFFIVFLIWTAFKFVSICERPTRKDSTFIFHPTKNLESVLRNTLHGKEQRVGDPPIVQGTGHRPSKPFVSESRPICTQAY